MGPRKLLPGTLAKQRAIYLTDATWERLRGFNRKLSRDQAIVSLLDNATQIPIAESSPSGNILSSSMAQDRMQQTEELQDTSAYLRLIVQNIIYHDFAKAGDDSTTLLGQSQKDAMDSKVDSSQMFEMQLTLTKSVWQRYVRFFQTQDQRWMTLSHVEQLEILLDLAEKAKTANIEKEPCTPETPKSISVLCQMMTPLPPMKAFLVTIGTRTPESDQSSISGLNDAIVSSLNSRFRSGMAESNDVVASALTIFQAQQQNKEQKVAMKKSPVKQVPTVKKRQMPQEFDEDSDSSWNDGTKPKKGKIETRTFASEKSKSRNLVIRLDSSLQQRYKKFFEKIGWANNRRVDQLVLLIRLAENHPDLIDDAIAAPSFDLDEIKKSARSDLRYTEMKSLLHVKLLSQWQEKYVDFFDKHGWGSRNSEKKMEILLELAECHPAFFENAKEDRVAFDKSKFPTDNKKEDKTIDDDLQSDKAKDLPIALLAPDYYMKFSEEARRKRPPDSARTYAAMANTRRYIVEWRQLKQLIARCACLHDECQKLINHKTIKIKEVGCVIAVTAQCYEKHSFSWSSSAQVRHEKRKQSSAYVLNVALASAIHFSGNSWTKLEYFGKVLRLSLGQKDQHFRVVQGCCLPVVKKCFEMTQREMLEKLKEQNGEIVLAGDGQFDSPGSCATLCTYTLMALGVDEKKDDDTKALKRFGYVISQAVIDRRHAENKSTNMERVGLHWALQPVIKAGVKVAELVTDEHGQIVSDFKKINAAAAERAANEKRKCGQYAALKTFKDLLSTALLHAQPPVDVEKNASELLSFYSAIIPSNDIWHKAKNLLKSVSAAAQSASTKEQACYSRYAKMLRNYLWECAEKAKGNAHTFTDLWTTVEKHLKGEHEGCSKVDLHSKTKLMHDLDQSTPSFAKLIACINRVTATAEQLCRFRNTGILESYNGLTLKYCPKRISYQYDVMTMRRELAALDHNHHVVRSYLKKQNGKLAVSQAYKKSTKVFRLRFPKEAKTYEYVGHLMAAVLLQRCQPDFDFRFGLAVKSAAHPARIQASLAPHEQSMKVTCQQYLSRTKAARHRVVAVSAKKTEKMSGKKRKATISSSSTSRGDSEESSSKTVSSMGNGNVSDEDEDD